MSTEEQTQDSTNDHDTAMQESTPPTGPAAMAPGNKKRPRIDLAVESRERKRGKTMFGLLVGTLKKAQTEDKERNASEAAKKRQLIEQRLQDKLRKETDSVRRAEEAKKDKTIANRKEEELQLNDSIHKLRRTRLPLLVNFLLTSDDIPATGSPPPPSAKPLAPPPRSNPPPLYYLPAILTPAQEDFIKRRKAEVSEAAEKEWIDFREERTAGVAEIMKLRERVAEEDARKKTERDRRAAESMEKEAVLDKDVAMADADADVDVPAPAPATNINGKDEVATKMEVDAGGADLKDGPKAEAEEVKAPITEAAHEPERKEDPAPAPADDDDAVEY